VFGCWVLDEVVEVVVIELVGNQRLHDIVEPLKVDYHTRLTKKFVNWLYVTCNAYLEHIRVTVMTAALASLKGEDMRRLESVDLAN
jgi:hypothetical protein